MSEFEKSKLRISNIHKHILVGPNQHTVAICQGSSIGGATNTAEEFLRRWNSHDAYVNMVKKARTAFAEGKTIVELMAIIDEAAIAQAKE